MTSSTDTPADYYRLLGISPDATLEEIRAAYRAKLRLWHPDLVTNKTGYVPQAATAMTAQLNVAYECLSDPDQRSAYDTSSRAGTASTRPTTTPLLVVSPRTMRCDVTPGDTVRLTLDVRADSPPGGNDLRVRTSDQLAAATFTATALTAKTARVTVQADTSKLGAHRIFHIPITVTWGTLTGTATLMVHPNELRKADSTPPYRRGPTSSSRRHRTRSSNHRMRDITTISLGGIALPLLLLAWTSGQLPVQTPANPRLVAAVGAGVIAATTWLLTSSRLLRQPDRLARVGVIWGHLMRWSGWILVSGCAVLLGIPAALLTLMAVIATPFLGLVIIAFISSRFDSQSR